MKNSALPLSVVLPVANLSVKISTNSPALIDYFKMNYLGRGVSTPTKTAALSFEVFEDEDRRYRFRCPQVNFNLFIGDKPEERQNWCVAETVKILSQYYFLNRGILFLHASAIVHEGKAYVFGGYAGSGKSTISNIAGMDKKMADDQVVLKKVNNSYRIYSSIFDIKQKRRNYEGVLLKKMFLLVQSETLKIKPITSLSAVLSFLINNDLFNAAFEFYLNQNKEESPLHFEIANQLYGQQFKEEQFRLYLRLYKSLRFNELHFYKNVTKDTLFGLINPVAK
jgi:hypothetical protein